jgi:hypothetical protein
MCGTAQRESMKDEGSETLAPMTGVRVCGLRGSGPPHSHTRTPLILHSSPLIPAGTQFATKLAFINSIKEGNAMNRSRIKSVSVLAVATLVTLVALDWASRGNAARSSAADKSAQASRDAKGPKKPLLAKFMRQKLTASSEVLEGLCTEDFALIEKGAKSLRAMSDAEKWRVSNDAMYRQHSAEFRSGVDKLLKAAKDKKIDSAALAWTKTTLNCIECHRWVKAMLITDKGKK